MNFRSTVPASGTRVFATLSYLLDEEINRGGDEDPILIELSCNPPTVGYGRVDSRICRLKAVPTAESSEWEVVREIHPAEYGAVIAEDSSDSQGLAETAMGFGLSAVSQEGSHHHE